jgi:L1 cell adhesion molecule like protein
MESIDDIREGDGERILRCWRYFLLLFKATGRKNYSIEAFTLLTQYHFLYTE